MNLTPETWNFETYVPRTVRLELQQRGRLPVSECIELGLALATALEHLHGHGLVHRDIKPSNIIYVQSRPKLADIGLVTRMDDTMSFVGTTGYLPPEGPGTARGDIYSLGKVLYEACTGRDRQQFPELPTHLGDPGEEKLLLEFNEIVLRSCHPDPARRYPSASELRRDLASLQAGESIVGCRERERFWLATRKIAAALALMLTLGALGIMAVRKPASAGPPKPRRLGVAEAQFWGTPRLPRQFDFGMFGGTIRMVLSSDTGLSLWTDGSQENRPLKLAGFEGWSFNQRISQARWAPDGRQFLMQAVKVVGGTQREPIQVWALFLVNPDTGEWRQAGPEVPDGERVASLAWRPDGASVTCLSWSGNFYSLDVATGQTNGWDGPGLAQLRPNMAPGHVQFGDYAPDGRWLPVSIPASQSSPEGERDLWLLAHGGETAVPLVEGPGLDDYATWSSDGETIYYISNAGPGSGQTWALWKVRIDPETGWRLGQDTQVLARPGQQLLHPRFLDEDRMLALAVMEPNSRVWTAADTLGDAVEISRGNAPALSPDGATVYFAGDTPEMQGIFAIPRGGRLAPRRVSRIQPSAGNSPRSSLRVSPDGEFIATTGWDGKRLGVFVIPTNGGPARLFEPLAEWSDLVPEWSPDGQWIALVRGASLMRMSRDGGVREELGQVHAWEGWTVRWSPDGKHVAALGFETPAHKRSGSSAAFAIALSDKQRIRLTPESEQRYKEGLEWHPDSLRLTYFHYGPDRYDAKIRWAFLDAPGRTEEMIDQDDHWDYVGNWAPDGHRFFFHSSNLKTQSKTIHLYDAETGQITREVRGGHLPEWSRDGRVSVWHTSNPVRSFEVIEGVR